MAIRFYLTNLASEYTPATRRGAWDSSTATLARRLLPTPQGTAATAALAETSATTNWDVLLGRWTFKIAKSGSLSGTLTWIIGALESDAAANMFWHVHAFVTVGESNTVRGTILTDNIGATEWPTTPAVGRGEGAKTLTAVTVTAGDVLVVEVGYRAVNTGTAGYTGTIYYGGGINTDLASGGNPTAASGWMEFSDPNDVLAKPPSALTDDFNDNVVDTVKWPFSYGTYSESGGKARVAALANGNYSALETFSQFALRDAAVWAQVTPPSGSGSDWAGANIALYDLWLTSGNHSYLVCYVDSAENGTGGVGWYCTVDGVSQWSESFAPNPGQEWVITNPWMRLRESGGTIYFEIAPDGATWTLVASRTMPAALRSSNRLTVDLEAARSVAGSTVDGTAASFDYLNLPPPPPGDLILTRTVIDDFEDGTFNTALWGMWNPGTVAESGGQAVITSTTGGDWNGFSNSTGTAIDRNDAHVGARVTVPTPVGGPGYWLTRLDVDGPVGVGGGEAFWKVVNDAGNIRLRVERTPAGGAYAEVLNIAYNPAVHVFVALGFSGGNFQALWSTDGGTWTVAHSETNPFATTLAGVSFMCAAPAAGTTTMGVEEAFTLASTTGPGTGAGGGGWFYAGAGAGAVIRRGSGSAGWSFTGSGGGRANRRGAGSGAWGFVGSAVGRSVRAGAAAGSDGWVGVAFGRATRRGSAAGLWQFAASAVGARVPTGAAGGGWGFAGVATGAAVRRGTSAGVVAFSGSASGVAPDVPAAGGEAAGQVSWSGSAIGVSGRSGTGGGSWTFGSAAAGRRSPRGSAAAGWGFSGASAGRRSPAASATGGWGFTGAATGEAPTVPVAAGQGVGGWAWAGVAVAGSGRVGSAAGGWGFTGQAAGRRSPQGSAQRQWGFTGTAAGGRSPVAAAAGQWVFVGNAAAGSGRAGTGSGSWLFTGAAAGVTARRGAAGGGFGVGPFGEFPFGGADAQVSWSGAAAGSAPAVEAAEGSGVGGFTFGSAASGYTLRQGRAGAGGFGESPFGEAPFGLGDPAGTVVWFGAGAGQRPGSGATASGVWLLAGSAAGRRTPASTAAGVVVWVGVATTGNTRAGSGTGSWGFTGSGSGREPARGTAAGGWVTAGAAAGRSARAGTAGGAWVFTTAAAGLRAPLGVAVGATVWLGSAGADLATGSASGATTWTGWALRIVLPLRAGEPVDTGSRLRAGAPT